MMKLKTITLADLQKTDLQEQMKKIREEIGEVGFAYNNYKWDIHENGGRLEEYRLHLISELYDLMQAAAGALWILEGGVSMNNEHIEKIKGYVETGRTNNKAREE
jgi:hypothetical protein